LHARHLLQKQYCIHKNTCSSVHATHPKLAPLNQRHDCVSFSYSLRILLDIWCRQSFKICSNFVSIAKYLAQYANFAKYIDGMGDFALSIS